MIAGVVVALAILFFAASLRGLGVMRNSVRVVALSKEALSLLKDVQVDDLEKERAMRNYSARMGLLFLKLVLGTFGSAFGPWLGIWLLDRFGIASMGAVTAELLTVRAAIYGTMLSIVVLRQL